MLEAEDVIKQLAAEVQTIASATAAEQRAATAYQRGVELVAQATDHCQKTANAVDVKLRETLNQVEAMEQRAVAACQSSLKLMAEATDHLQTTANKVDQKLHEVLNQTEVVKKLSQKQVADALDEAKTVRQLIDTEHVALETAKTGLKERIKWAVGIGIGALVLAMSTLVYALRHLHK